MKKVFVYGITAILLLSVNPSFADNEIINFDDRIAYDSASTLKHTLRKIDLEINKYYREIHRTKISKNLSEKEKKVKIRKLKREIISKENEKQRIKSKYRQIIS